MDPRLLEILACPQCQGPLQMAAGKMMLVCKQERLGYPIEDGIPHLLVQEALAIPEIEIAAMEEDDAHAEPPR
ncbi:MAG: hypothetical protein RLY67_501 [Pseudomonadota bacterium]